MYVAALYINTAVPFKSNIPKISEIYYWWPPISILLFEKNICISDLLRILVCDLVAMPGKFILFPVRDNVTSQEISV